ncbi:MAG: tail assembly chaperone [Limosilactobacillus sp.]|nr:tail assembly chaperone [Limosilactobacillus sp.]
MQLKINDQTYDVKFGMAFLRELNERAGLIAQGFNIGVALQRIIPGLLANDLTALETIIQAALKASDVIIGQSELDEYFESLTAKQTQKLMDSVLTNLDKSNVTHGPLAQARAGIEEVENQLQA